MIQILQASIEKLFFVGDIHGQFDLFMTSLRAAGFNQDKGDVVISVGDMIDRGPDSIKMLQLLETSWFHAVMGNHERMLLDGLNLQSDTCLADRWNWQKMNGGDWYTQSEELQSEVLRLIPTISALPLAIEVNTDQGRIGVIHANVPNNQWPSASVLLEPNIKKHVMWSREKGQLARVIVERYMNTSAPLKDPHILEAIEDFPNVAGIDWVVLGHTIMPNLQPVQLANTLFLDVGAAHGNAPKVINATHLLEQSYRLH